jgi:serine/threonine protein kinase
MSARADLPPWRPDPRNSIVIDNRFELLDDIGEGATSVVFKARDQVTQQVVALKVLKGAAALHPRLAAGFRREAEVGQRIVHPNVIGIHHSGTYEGWLYIAMEFISGRTLADYLAIGGRLTLAEFQRVFEQILAALACIHAGGIVHRDIKPANIMMTREGVWKLMDFGISRESGLQATAGPSLGTPEYMSPEQLLGHAATQASDLYAAGVVFFEALTGARPFRNWQPVERCKSAPPRVRPLRPDAPQWLDDLIARALEPRPEERPQSAEAMRSSAGTFEADASARVAEQEQEPAPLPLAPAAPPESIPLATLISPGPADLSSALGLMAEALRRLQYIASTGGNHEPLTPHTLRLLPSGRVEISPHGPTGERDTQMVANPKYAAPELLRGRATSPVKSDLYALGFVMYEYLLGTALFRQEFPDLDERGTGLGWMEWHSDPAKRLRPATEIVPAIPAALSQLLEQMTTKDLAKRCATYEEALHLVSGLANRTQVTQQIRVPGPEVAVQTPQAPRTYSMAQIGIIAGLIFVTLIGIATLAARLLR